MGNLEQLFVCQTQSNYRGLQNMLRGGAYNPVKGIDLMKIPTPILHNTKLMDACRSITTIVPSLPCECKANNYDTTFARYKS